MNVLKICVGTWVNASHDKRELSAVRELGAKVFVVAKGDAAHQETEVDGFPVTRLSARPLGDRVPVVLNRAASIFTWAAQVRKMDADVISGHDLGGLAIGYLSNFGKRKKAKLVYDSHEFTTGRDEIRGKAEARFLYHLEHFLIKRCAFSIMVNDSIAKENQRIHHLKELPVVARNIPPYWELDEARTAQTRAGLLAQMHLPADTFLVMYHGGVVKNRGIEEMLIALAKTENTAGIVLGNAESAAYLSSLREKCTELGLESRVLFHLAVPIEQLRHYVSAVDVGMVTVLASSPSHYLMLPNKFFENIQSLTPVIVSDFPEVGRLVDQYGIGLRVDPTNVDEISAAIERMRTDREFYNVCKENLKQAKEDLCWEKEKAVLKEAYSRIL